MGELTTRFPWEAPAVRSTEDTVAALQRDFAYAVQMTGILVHSNRPELAILVNSARGQIVPRGQCKFTDGSTVELHDIGMPQVNCPVMSVAELMARVWEIARELNLELVP